MCACTHLGSAILEDIREEQDISSSQSIVHGPEESGLPGNLWEMQSAESETQGGGAQ
jgi:hypothetical protein